MKAIRIEQHGGPEVMQWVDVDLPVPGPGEVRLRHTAIGINFSDINVRRGGFYYPEPMAMPTSAAIHSANKRQDSSITRSSTVAGSPVSRERWNDEYWIDSRSSTAANADRCGRRARANW